MITPAQELGAPAVAKHVLPRRTCLERGAAGRATRGQRIAANVDLVIIVSSLDGDLSPRRLERYLAAVRAAGAEPVILLTKAGGLSEDALAESLARARAAAPGVDVHALDVISGLRAELPAQLIAGRTAALVGSSGVGKSTLVNHLLGRSRMATREVRRRDQRGQHTTSHRELLWLPGGGAVIDTPGMREFAIWAPRGALDEVFPELERRAAECRFADCRHEREPGCAIQAAIARGELDGERLRSWRTLEREREATAARAVVHEQRARERALSKHYREVQRAHRRYKR